MALSHRSSELERARRLLEREKAKEDALKAVLENRHADPTVLAKLKMPGINGLQSHRSSRRSSRIPSSQHEQGDANTNYATQQDLYHGIQDGEQNYLEEKRGDQESGTQGFVAHGRRTNSANPANTASHTPYHKVLVVKEDPQLRREVLEQQEVEKRKRIQAREHVLNELRRKEDEIRLLREKEKAEMDRRLREAQEVDEMLTKREEDRLASRKKAIERQSHHVVFYQRVVEEKQEKIREEERKVHEEQEKMNQKMIDRDESDKRKKKEVASTVQKVQMDQVDEKKRIQVFRVSSVPFIQKSK
eukprot:TRINITY_DN969_c0_g1_i10.p1 TRINITY_DN969_c0_g1~~TRINITY_DN969_c0_g1_i10.p1  ORF type:complete len:303 (+),score=74.58 TRINITY_DN969_c0_g1_i10:64-972(+)